MSQNVWKIREDVHIVLQLFCTNIEFVAALTQWKHNYRIIMKNYVACVINILIICKLKAAQLDKNWAATVPSPCRHNSMRKG